MHCSWAVVFLREPVSEEKLKNIWQHVVHQALNAGGGAVPNSLKPVKETVASMLQLKPGEDGDRLPAPTTPQLEQFSRSSRIRPRPAVLATNPPTKHATIPPLVMKTTARRRSLRRGRRAGRRRGGRRLTGHPICTSSSCWRSSSSESIWQSHPRSWSC
ncbi:uncharacterized protein LOC144703183 isoform X2 [Wolffia australiana]